MTRDVPVGAGLGGPVDSGESATEGSLADLAGAPCLVTGGAGAIGSNVVRALAARRCQTVVLDNFSSGYLENLDGLAGVTVIRGDVAEGRDVAAAMAGEPAYVFHLAAQFANQNSVDHPLEDMRTNVLGTLVVLEACRALPALRRVVYASSSCVLGGQAGVLTEDAPLLTDTPYAVSKLAGEYYARTYHDTFGVPTTVLRYFNVFGPGERPGRYRNVIPNFIRRALDGESLTITGTGEETREYVFVDDAVHATLLAAVTDPAQGQVLHVGSGAVLTTRGLAERVLAATGSRAPVTHVARRSWDAVAHRSTSSAKARRMLGYEPRVPFDEGLARTVEWIRRLPTPDR